MCVCVRDKGQGEKKIQILIKMEHRDEAGISKT